MIYMDKKVQMFREGYLVNFKGLSWMSLLILNLV